MKAPRIGSNGCPRCGTCGIVGHVCACCVRALHGEAVRASHPIMQRCDNVDELRVAQERNRDVHAAWVGADLLLGSRELHRLRVGLELPEPRS